MKANKIGEFLGVLIEGPDIDIDHNSSLRSAIPGALVFLSKLTPEYISKFNTLNQCLVLVPKTSPDLSNPKCAIARVENPRLDFAKAVKRFFLDSSFPCISPTAYIDPTAILEDEVSVGHFAVVGAGVRIGFGTVIGDHAVVKNASIGRYCSIKAHAVIGEDGFGFDFESNGVPVKMPHTGQVLIEEYVEIGSFTTVNRGTLDQTILRANVKLDDHVHIAHNAEIDECTLVVACAEVSGNVRIGKRGWIAPNASIINGIELGDDVMVGIGSVINKSVGSNSVVVGVPGKFVRAKIADK